MIYLITFNDNIKFRMEEHNLYLPLLDTMINKDLEANNIWMDVSYKNSYTCEEGGGTTQNFCLAFTDLLEKQLLLKKMLKANKKCKNFNSSNIVFFKKNRKTPGDIISLYLRTKVLMI